MMVKTITVDGVQYAPVQTNGTKLRLLVVDNRGLTFVGRCDLSGTQDEIVIHDARCVIVWGTKAHLAELVRGPTPNTKLGHAETVTVFRKNLVLSYELEESAWALK